MASDSRCAQIPRGPVYGVGTRGAATCTGFPRVDQQGCAHFTVSGRTAILHALRGLGFVPGDRVLVPTYHCPTMVEPVARLGGEPVFYPLRASGAADVEHLAKADLAGVKALLAAHFFGLPQDMLPLRRFCDSHGLTLIEDCAHAYFGMAPNAAIGAMGDVAIASLPKFFPVVEGGCLVLRKTSIDAPELASPDLAHEVRVVWDAMELAASADRLGAAGAAVRWLVRLKRRLRGRSAEVTARAPVAGAIDSPFDTIDDARAKQRAAMFVRRTVQSADVQRLVGVRRANYRLFAEKLSQVPGLRPLFPKLPGGAAPYVFPLWVDTPDELYPALRASGVPLFRWDIRWPGTPVLADDAAASWASHVFQLACHQDMTGSDVSAIVTTLLALHNDLTQKLLVQADSATGAADVREPRTR